MRDRLWQDGGHFNEEIGAAVFDAMYSGKHGFGAMVTAQNFDQRVTEVEAQRRTFRSSNGWLDEELAEIARKLPELPPPAAR